MGPGVMALVLVGSCARPGVLLAERRARQSAHFPASPAGRPRCKASVPEPFQTRSTLEQPLTARCHSIPQPLATLISLEVTTEEPGADTTRSARITLPEDSRSSIVSVSGMPSATTRSPECRVRTSVEVIGTACGILPTSNPERGLLRSFIRSG